MTRAEEAAKMAYPDNEVLFFAQDDEGKNHPVTTFGREINGFIFGYEQAEKDLGWISVKERLPGSSEWVVACVEVSGICTCLALATYDEETKEWHTDDWEGGEPEVYNPDYWMPIPTKVKEEEK